MLKGPLRKAKKKVEPAPIQTDMTEGVPVQSQLGGDEVTSYLSRTSADVEPEAEDASSMFSEAPVNTQMRTENRVENMYADSIKSREEVAKI